MSLNINDGRVIGFREKNEKESENQIYAEYNPKAATDTRKAYFAKYLDPAIAQIEKQNAVANRQKYAKNKLAALHSISSGHKAPYNFQPENINLSAMRLLNNKKQNG